MAIDTTHELQQLHDFIGQRLASGSKMSAVEAVAEFQRYQAELEVLRESLEASFARKERGEGKILDINVFKREMQDEWNRRRSGGET